jgi:hypothetical protein
MNGLLSNFTLRLVGKAAEVARLYQGGSHPPFDPWQNSLHTLNSLDYIPLQSIVIGSGLENLGKVGKATVKDIALVVPTMDVNRRSSGYAYSVSLHASFGELFATAMAVRCQQVGLYHGQVSRASHSNPLISLLQKAGRRVIHLAETPQLVGGLS